MINDKTDQLHSDEAIEIDSLKFRISIDLVQLNPHSTLMDKWYEWNETSNELYPLHKRVPRQIINKIGYKYEYYIQHVKSQRYLFIKINSKMLESRYLEGITLSNIKLIYEEIIKQEVVFFSFEHFLTKSFCTDVDFKKDFRSPSKEYKKHLKHLRIITPQRKDSYGYDPYHGGLNWNGRSTKNPASHPNFKVYDKEAELATRSRKFTEVHLVGQDLTNLRRLEFTLKNKEHMESVQILNSCLQTLLNLTQQQKETILEKVVNKCLDTDFSIIDEDEVDESDLSPAQLNLLNSLRLALKYSTCMQQAIDMLTIGQTVKNKHKYAKKYSELYEKYIFKTVEDNIEVQGNYTLWKLLLRLDTLKAKEITLQPLKIEKPVDRLQHILNDYGRKAS